ncbi:MULTISPECIES: YtxH domain-containing protein [unclassified Staphylococcus]|uniref:YtxH domain-containing protein n=1 Tax=unclassified Staphylococcus TaxID=91994 RepID=UPI0021CE2D56|nr:MULTISPECIES: YtxH domain-containing protein [unclassified Staphylococcus]UXR71034.1 YtxH domain-containing protein [Staphylococcus sp. IVB6240]UXR73260.1 YtxH domain-containing protein [Staphylococcus sp. IVB6238]UXR75559.1 YtxH domain-containing protein [Staphylococcus sp. IVB6233]UXR79760.1 YtxH domain-containing protein [Staphylococcus sp. IVB6218]
MKNKFVPGILIGATLGGAIALIDKNTRHSVKTSFQNVKNGQRSSQPSKVSSIVDEVMYWKDTLEEIRRNNPELERSLIDAKDTLVARKNNKQIGHK